MDSGGQSQHDVTLDGSVHDGDGIGGDGVESLVLLQTPAVDGLDVGVLEGVNLERRKSSLLRVSNPS